MKNKKEKTKSNYASGQAVISLALIALKRSNACAPTYGR